MAIIKKSELKQMKQEDLKDKLKELRMEMIKINAQRSSKTIPENPGRVKEVRRTIAGILTRLHRMESAKEGTK